MKLTLKVWRQQNAATQGEFRTYHLNDVSPDVSFLEMFDQLNEQLVMNGEEPVAFDHDCREGICGACSMYINGKPHGPLDNITTCQLHMRHFSDGETIVVEPWRANAFPVIKDLVSNRNALDRMIQSGGFISVNTGSAPEANSVMIEKEDSDMAFDSATCIGCGACVAACKNASAMLFVSAKVSHLARLPQGIPEKRQRVLNMIAQMDYEGFGACTNTQACIAACPANIPFADIAKLNAEYIVAGLGSSKFDPVKKRM